MGINQEILTELFLECGVEDILKLESEEEKDV